jgi:hypothetical protein
MNADQFAAGWASPSFLFFFEELVYSIFLNVLQIIDHAHSIFYSVARIKCFQVFAWEISAFKAVINLPVAS